MNHQNDPQQQEKALKHCQQIKEIYDKCRSLGHARFMNHGGSYTHIPLELWETIETMLNDDIIFDKSERRDK